MQKLKLELITTGKFSVTNTVSLSVVFVVVFFSRLAVYPVVRNRGHFGEVSVFWVLEPALSGDVSPLQGIITFREGEHLKNLTLFSVPDEVKL